MSIRNHVSASYARSVAVGAILLVMYPVLAYYGPKNGRAEFYPFFNWSLFTNASDIRVDVVMIVKTLNGEDLDQPTYFFSMKDAFVTARRGDASFAKLLDDYAVAYFADDATEMTRIENILVTRYMPEAGSIAFDIAAIRYRPDQRYWTGEVLETHLLNSVEFSR